MDIQIVPIKLFFGAVCAVLLMTLKLITPEALRGNKALRGILVFLTFFLLISQLYDNLSGYKPAIYGLIGGFLVVALNLLLDRHETNSPQTGVVKNAVVKIKSKLGDNTYIGELASTYEQIVVTCDKELDVDEIVCIEDITDKIIVTKIKS